MSTTIYVLSRNKKTNVYPCKPQFYYIKVGFTGVKIIWACFRDVLSLLKLPKVLSLTMIEFMGRGGG